MTALSDWMNAERGRAYGTIVWVVGAVLAIGLYGHMLAPAWSDRLLRVAPTDFDAFWAAGRLALQGHAAAAYDPATMMRMQASVTQPAGGGWFPFMYPPVFLLMCLPLGLLPYLVALPVFVLAGYSALVACLQRILGASWPRLAVLMAPACLLNAVVGQNGFLSATCFAGALLALETRPLVGGACLGMLAFKPHLAVAVPVVLLAARRWHALGAGAATAAALVLASAALLGAPAWTAFIDARSMMATMLQSPVIWPKLMSVYGAARLFRAGSSLAFALQGVSLVLCLGWVAMLAARRPGQAAEVALCVAAALLCTPFLWDYDLACMLVPMAWIGAQAARSGWLPWEKPLLIVLYLLPVLARGINLTLALPLMPFAAALLLATMSARLMLARPAPILP